MESWGKRRRKTNPKSGCNFLSRKQKRSNRRWRAVWNMRLTAEASVWVACQQLSGENRGMVQFAWYWVTPATARGP
jgi:hypothetical protein